MTKQIMAKVAELCGHDEIEAEEPLSSFGFSSISVAELAAFIQTQFNHQASTLELMTTASAASLARDIVGASSEVDADSRDADSGRCHRPGFLKGSASLEKAFGLCRSLRGSLPDTSKLRGGLMERVTAVPKLAGILPPECRKDLAALNGVVQETFRRENPAQAVSVSDFQKVLLTGACGFVGRFLLRDFLEQRPEIEVHCLVRADDAEHGRRRLREALEEAAIWDDAFESRLHVVVGDIECPRLGLSKSDFDDLCQEMDAVYHLAATLSLATSYSSVRGSNVGGLSHLLELCLSKRFKHFFYASTMGIFPAYFCTFANEFADSRIEHQMQPDLATMKRVFPRQLGRIPLEQVGGGTGLALCPNSGATAWHFPIAPHLS